MASPAETTLIVLTAAMGVHLIDPESAKFWQIVTAIGMTVTPLLALLGKRLGRQIDRTAPAPAPAPAHDEGPRAIIIGFGQVGRLVADMLAEHGKAYLVVDSDPDLIVQGQRAGYPVIYGDAARGSLLDHLDLTRASAVILTMDDLQGVQKLVRRLSGQHPALPIIARARDAEHAAALYRAGANSCRARGAGSLAATVGSRAD